MKWVRIDEHRYINEEQLRDLQFVRKGDDNYFYRLVYSNGQHLDVPGFVNLEDAKEHAAHTFGLETRTNELKASVKKRK